MRMIENFDQNWHFAKTVERPACLPSNWEAVTLPHTWNAIDGQDGGNDYWRGTAMYAKAFPKPVHDGAVVLEFLGAAMTADVYVNGHHLAHHEGGYRYPEFDFSKPNWKKITTSPGLSNILTEGLKEE